jgi:translocator protein
MRKDSRRNGTRAALIPGMRPTSWSQPGREPVPSPVHHAPHARGHGVLTLDGAPAYDDDDEYLDYAEPFAYEKPTRVSSIVVLLSLVVICNGLGWIGAAFTDQAYYLSLESPPWAPVPELFAPVWTTLYTLMGIAAWLVWRSPITADRAAALGWFAGQLVLNAMWTPIFFGAHQIGAALVTIAILFGAILATVVAFWRASKLAAVLIVPYLGWVGFAVVLNGALWWLNP